MNDNFRDNNQVYSNIQLKIYQSLLMLARLIQLIDFYDLSVIDHQSL